jgi:hypothetical protein
MSAIIARAATIEDAVSVSSTVSHRERVLRFQARQLLMDQLRRSVEQIGGSPAQGVADLPRENSAPRMARLVLIGRRSSV